MSRSSIKLHTPNGRRALDAMLRAPVASPESAGFDEKPKRGRGEGAASSVNAAARGKPGAPVVAVKLAKGVGEIRIIGGKWRRTRLPVAMRAGLRPTPDRVRETLFNWLGQDLGGWRCLDAFAGTGALGLEAASRGATSVLMNEIEASLAQQLQKLKTKLSADNVKLQRGDAVSCLRQVTAGTLDLVFLDPPFENEDLFLTSLQAAAAAINAGGYIYLEAPQHWSTEQLEAVGLSEYRYLKAGAVHAHLLRKKEAI